MDDSLNIKTFYCLGGLKTLHKKIETTLQAHDLIMQGIPWQCVVYLQETLPLFNTPEHMKICLGISKRQLTTHKNHFSKKLSRSQSNRVWRFGTIYVKAFSLLQDDVQTALWFTTPNVKTDNKPPMDFLVTSAGIPILETALAFLKEEAV